MQIALRRVQVLLFFPLVGNPVVQRFDTTDLAAYHVLVLPRRRRGRNRQSAFTASGASIGPVASGGLRLVLVDDTAVGTIAMIDPRNQRNLDAENCRWSAAGLRPGSLPDRPAPDCVATSSGLNCADFPPPDAGEREPDQLLASANRFTLLRMYQSKTISPMDRTVEVMITANAPPNSPYFGTSR
jgi:hypothetical protein